MSALFCGRALPALRSALARATGARTLTGTRNVGGSRVMEGKLDRFGGVTVDLGDTLFTPDIGEEEFGLLLTDSLQRWRAEGRVAVWLKVPVAHSRLLPVAASQGFAFHHARGDRATLSLWLAAGDSRLPEFATHQVGVAGAVLDESNGKVLVVQDKNK
ncbi:nucleoside diphosphate-linked moiety X motif 6 isoform X1, partial [Arapaima gigas]